MLAWLKRLWYHFRHGWRSAYPPLRPADVDDGKVPDIWRGWLVYLQRDVSMRVTDFYLDSRNRSSAYALTPAQAYVYGEPFERLVQRVEIIEGLPKGVRGAIRDDASGLTTLRLDRESMNNPLTVKHELLHAMQYKHPELYGPLGKGHVYPGTTGLDHWPVIFDPYGTS